MTSTDSSPNQVSHDRGGNLSLGRFAAPRSAGSVRMQNVTTFPNRSRTCLPKQSREKKLRARRRSPPSGVSFRDVTANPMLGLRREF